MRVGWQARGPAFCSSPLPAPCRMPCNTRTAAGRWLAAPLWSSACCCLSPGLRILAEPVLQDFTILVLLGAGCLSLGLELLVNRKAVGESSWIEGASILAAGACCLNARSAVSQRALLAALVTDWQGPRRGKNAQPHRCFSAQVAASARLAGESTRLPSLCACSVRGGAGHGSDPLIAVIPRPLPPIPLLLQCAWWCWSQR